MERIISRPGIFWRIAAAVFLAFSLLFLLSASPQTWELTLVGTAMFGIPAVLISGYCLMNIIEASTDGLRWRDRRGWHSVAWDDVTDFHEVVGRRSSDGTSAVVRIESGEEMRFDASWTNAATLRLAIAERAHHADPARMPNEQRAWTTRGARPAELPQVFRYSAFRLKQHRTGNIVGMMIVVGLFAALGIAPWFVSSKPPLSTGVCILMSVLCLGGVFVPILGMRREWWQLTEAEEMARRGEEFQVTATGLSFRREGENRFVTWEDITSYQFRRYAFVIHTAQGVELRGDYRLSQYPVFCEIVRKYATEAVEENLANNQREDLGGIAARWTGGEEGAGDRVFHFRTRSMRVLVLFTWMVALMGLLPTILQSILDLPRADARIAFPISGILTASAVYATWRFRAARLCIGREGIARHLPFRTVTLRWEDVVRSSVEPQHIFLEGTDSTTIQLNTMLLSYGSEVAPLVQEHLKRTRSTGELS
jgi:hypothetical protein